MRSSFWTVGLALMLCCCNTNHTQPKQVDRAAVAAAVERQMTQFPESRLQDLYKSFFQDRFGPGHLISDREGALRYIEAEVQEAASMDGVLTEPCGWEGRYVRVSLQAVQEGLLSAGELVDALMQSAIPVDDRAVEAWKEEWKAILSEVKRSCPGLPGIEEDSRMLDSLLASGQYACHHSKAYNEAYHPHYRIIRKELADKLFSDRAIISKEQLTSSSDNLTMLIPSILPGRAIWPCTKMRRKGLPTSGWSQ